MIAFKKRREKIFGLDYGMPIDRNAKARIMAYAKAWSARHRSKGQHRAGPLTQTYQKVLHALVWGFCNTKSGKCFPSYETIAKCAECTRSVVHEAINALESAGILTWVNRVIRVLVPIRDGAGRLSYVNKLKMTSNAYRFFDPNPPKIAETQGKTLRTVTSNNYLYNSENLYPALALDGSDPLEMALLRLKSAMKL